MNRRGYASGMFCNDCKYSGRESGLDHGKHDVQRLAAKLFSLGARFLSDLVQRALWTARAFAFSTLRHDFLPSDFID